MSTIDTSTWNPDANLNTEIEGIPLNSDASIAQTWQALRVLMAAVKGDGDAIKAMIDVMKGATASADGASGLVPQPLAGDQDKYLKGDGTWGMLGSSDIPNIDASKIASGTIDLARLPAGALERLVTVADQTARYALTAADVQLGDTVKQLDTGVMYIVVDASKLGQAAGYVEYTAGSAASVPWSGVTSKPFTFTPSSHTHGNITNAGAIGSASGLPIVTGANGVLQAGSFGTTAGTFCEGNDARLSNARTPTSHTHGSITNDGKLATASRAVVTNGSGAIDVSSVTLTELGCLSGVTSAVQTQLDAKATDSEVVHLAGADIVTGTKTFSSEIITTGFNAIRFKNGEYGTFFRTDGQNLYLMVTAANDPDGLWTSQRPLRVDLATGVCNINGSAASISTSSDERLKTGVKSIPDDVLDAWSDVRWRQFQYREDAERGDASIRTGVVAQQVLDSFAMHGLDASTFALVCRDEAEGETQGFWRVSYIDALAIEAACQRRRADRLEKRMANLEARLTAMEAAHV